MMDENRRCIICGKILPRKRSKYCSAACASEGRRALERARGGSKTHPEPYRWIKCPDCGREVYVHIKSKRCSDCQRAADNRHNEEHRQRVKAGHGRQLGSMDMCERCGKQYVVNSGRQRYCPACAPIAWAENDRRLSREWNREYYSTPESREARNAERRALKPYNKTCAICGKPFTTDDLRTLCCSEDCERRRIRDYWKAYDAKRAEKRREDYKKRYAAIKADPEKRAEINRKAREAYAKRKVKKEDNND